MRLQLASKMPDDVRIDCLLAGWTAVDEACVAVNRTRNPPHMRRSAGHRMAGRPARYYLCGIGTLNAVVIEAYSDREALEEANRRLAGL